MKKLIFPAVLFIAFFGIARGARANYLYGVPGVSRQIVVDKKIFTTKDNAWHDDLSADFVTFTADGEVRFRMIVKNSGAADLVNIKVVDTLPDLVVYNWGGTYDSANRQINWSIDSLKAGEEKELEATVKVVSSDKLKGVASTCPINRVSAKAESGENDEDTAKFCVETRILGEKLPSAGVDSFFGILAGLGTTLIGIVLKQVKKVKKLVG